MIFLDFSVWVHLRNWPFVLRRFLKDEDEPALHLGLQLHELVERITASEFREHEIDILEEKIYEYLDSRATLRNEYPRCLLRPKPKHHFM